MWKFLGGLLVIGLMAFLAVNAVLISVYWSVLAWQWIL